MVVLEGDMDPWNEDRWKSNAGYETSSAYEERAGILEYVQARGESIADDVVVNTASIVERCLQRIEDEYQGDSENLYENVTRQDAIGLNLQRACQAAFDQVG